LPIYFVNNILDLFDAKFGPSVDLFTCLDLGERDYNVSKCIVSSGGKVSKLPFEIAILSFLLGGLCC
jgi:hypothetical protein